MGKPSEGDIIALFAAAGSASQLALGGGDDCAVIAKDATTDWLVTTDALYEGVHFRRDWTDLETLGSKAVLVNASDIAAMGGEARFYLVSVGLPRGDREDAAAIARGMQRVASEAGVVLIGGDTCRSESGLVITITMIGDVEKGAAVRRHGAKPGDAIYVSGTLGSSALGLVCLQRGKTDAAAQPFIARHHLPPPRLALGKRLRETGCVTSMIDVSDGLISDLGHIAIASRVGFTIEADRLPHDPGFTPLAASLGCDTLSLLATGGEDYELAFTVCAEHVTRFEKEKSVTRIGTIVADEQQRVVLGTNGKAVTLKKIGFDHFGGK